jgi:putative transposase
VHHLQQVNDIGERRACEATGFHRSSQRYKSRDDPQTELRMRLKDLAASRVRYGYRRLHILLLREGYRLNHKRTYRLYREEGLSIRSKVPRRKRAWRYRSGRPEIAGANHCWAMDFMSDALFDDGPFRLLTVVETLRWLGRLTERPCYRSARSALRMTIMSIASCISAPCTGGR